MSSSSAISVSNPLFSSSVDLDQWLEQNGFDFAVRSVLHEYCDNFDDFIHLKEEDFRSMPIKVGPRRRLQSRAHTLLSQLNELNETPSIADFTSDTNGSEFGGYVAPTFINLSPPPAVGEDIIYSQTAPATSLYSQSPSITATENMTSFHPQADTSSIYSQNSSHNSPIRANIYRQNFMTESTRSSLHRNPSSNFRTAGKSTFPSDIEYSPHQTSPPLRSRPRPRSSLQSYRQLASSTKSPVDEHESVYSKASSTASRNSPIRANIYRQNFMTESTRSSLHKVPTSNFRTAGKSTFPSDVEYSPHQTSPPLRSQSHSSPQPLASSTKSPVDENESVYSKASSTNSRNSSLRANIYRQNFMTESTRSSLHKVPTSNFRTAGNSTFPIEHTSEGTELDNRPFYRSSKKSIEKQHSTDKRSSSGVNSDIGDEIELLPEVKETINIHGSHATPLHFAAENDDKTTTLILLRTSDIEARDKDSNTPLHVAAHKGSLKVAMLLVNAGASVSVMNSNGWFPIHFAAQHGQESMMKFLHENGANLECSNKDGQTPLHIAAANHKDQIIKYLFQQEVNIEPVDKDGCTPLHLAVKKGSLSTVKLLLEHDIDIEAEDDLAETPLHIAVASGKSKIVKLLLDKRANIEASDMDGWRPLHVACANGKQEIVDILIQRGADIHALCKYHGRSPLHFAAKNGNPDIVKLLLNSHAHVDSLNKKGETALHNACWNGQENIVKFLLNNRANIEANGTASRETPLHYAARRGRTKIARVLLKYGANIHATNIDGDTALDLAKQSNESDDDEITGYRKNSCAAFLVEYMRNK